MQAKLILEDGTVFYGQAFGARKDAFGEVVFNTGITGYQEVLSDPSYCGQIVAMTYPLIGNYGINRDDFEAVRPYAAGFIVREHAPEPSNWRSELTLEQLLQEYDIPGIAGIDTRKLTRKIRHHGTMKGVIVGEHVSVEEAQERLRQPLRRDQVAVVSTKSVYSIPGQGPRIVLMDFGCKRGILKELRARDSEVFVVPYDATADEIRRLHPDGILLSNGPGDPKDVPQAIATIRELMGEYPLFGICLGHQLFALANGADTRKMKFGHRGANHPVKELATGRTYITAQNHGYAVTESSVADTELEITHVALNDGTVEGLRHKRYPAFSVQYHPEAAPGPYDSRYLFDRFMEMIAQRRKGAMSYAAQS
ncbi:carbamoyl phosphate synthase small subunit [Bacillaceae bacterium]